MTETTLAAALMSEVLSADQTLKEVMSRNLPKGMELSHFSVLNHLYGAQERSPVQLARAFQVTKGAMTNTLKRLEAAGHIHIRPDWDDARRKMVSISPAGRRARDIALDGLEPVFEKLLNDLGEERVRQASRDLRAFRRVLKGGD